MYPNVHVATNDLYQKIVQKLKIYQLAFYQNKHSNAHKWMFEPLHQKRLTPQTVNTLLKINQQSTPVCATYTPYRDVTCTLSLWVSTQVVGSQRFIKCSVRSYPTVQLQVMQCLLGQAPVY